MPQPDAWLGWRIKRMAPALTTRAMGFAQNVMDPQ